jgi:hypothetical protein
MASKQAEEVRQAERMGMKRARAPSEFTWSESGTSEMA